MRLLSARDIAVLAAQGILIRDQFRPKHCEGMAYALTLGSRVQSITKTERSYRAIDGALVLEPREAVNVEINEKFNFVDAKGRPSYCAIVIAGARLLAGGISHPATFIDPGFQHTTTLTLVNLRNHPSRALRPGSDAIAKLLVISLNANELPETWEPTPAYRQSGADDLPVLWSDSHLLAPWSPSGPDAAALAAVPTMGPPFDLLAAHLLAHEALLTDDDGRRRFIRDLSREHAAAKRDAQHAAESLGRHLALVEKAQGDLTDKVSAHDAELAGVRLALHQEVLRQRRERTEAIRYRGTAIIAVGSAIASAVLSAWLTVSLTDDKRPEPRMSDSSPVQTDATPTPRSSPRTR